MEDSNLYATSTSATSDRAIDLSKARERQRLQIELTQPSRIRSAFIIEKSVRGYRAARFLKRFIQAPESLLASKKCIDPRDVRRAPVPATFEAPKKCSLRLQSTSKSESSGDISLTDCTAAAIDRLQRSAGLKWLFVAGTDIDQFTLEQLSDVFPGCYVVSISDD
jgi:hypothetical protein